MDTRDESFVECLDAIGGEEEDTLEVFEETEKDADQRIAVDIVDRPFLQEDVGFVEEQECAPAVCNVW